MADLFDTRLKSQEQWSWLLALDLFLGGLGGGLFLLFATLDLPAAVAIASMGLVLLGAMFLLMEMGRPSRAWRAISKPRTSWISRGVIIVSVFTVTACLSAGADIGAISSLERETVAGKTLLVIAGLTAAGVAVYPGFVLSASPAIPSWHSSLVPFLFLAYSLTGASGLLLVFSPIDAWNSDVAGTDVVAAVLMGSTLLLVAVHVMSLKDSGLAARETLRLLGQGRLGLVFRGGVIFAGLIIPLLVLAVMPWVHQLAGGLMLIGALLFRYSILRSGVYVSSPLA